MSLNQQPPIPSNDLSTNVSSSQTPKENVVIDKAYEKHIITGFKNRTKVFELRPTQKAYYKEQLTYFAGIECSLEYQKLKLTPWIYICLMSGRDVVGEYETILQVTL